jgi:hypothetical protein
MGAAASFSSAARRGARDRFLPLLPFVHCRIQIRHENDRVIVHLAGRLGEAEVPDLLEACAAGAGPPILELDELISADAVGMDALLRIEQEGARLVGLPEYIRLKLDTLARERLH